LEGRYHSGIIFDEGTGEGTAYIRFNGIGNGEENYISFGSYVSGWKQEGEGLNYVPANGKVGIGITNPSAYLEVSGNILTTDQIRVNENVEYQFFNYNNVRVSEITSDVDGEIKFWTSSSNTTETLNTVMTLKTNGNVGIGIDPSAKFEVNGTSKFNYLVLIEGNGGTPYGNTDTTLQFKVSGGNRLVLSATDTHAYIQSHGSVPLIINSLGNNVGIGTDDPQAKLHVKGGRFRLERDGSDPVIELERTNVATNYIFTSSNGDLYLRPGNTYGSIVMADGVQNVGIGTGLVNSGTTDRLQVVSSSSSLCDIRVGGNYRSNMFYPNHNIARQFTLPNCDLGLMLSYTSDFTKHSDRWYSQTGGSFSTGTLFINNSTYRTFKAKGRGYRSISTRIPCSRSNNEILKITCKVFMETAYDGNTRSYIGVMALSEGGTDLGFKYLDNAFINQGNTKHFNANYWSGSFPVNTAYLQFIWLFNYSSDQPTGALNVCHLYDLQIKMEDALSVHHEILLTTNNNTNIQSITGNVPLYIDYGDAYIMPNPTLGVDHTTATRSSNEWGLDYSNYNINLSIYAQAPILSSMFLVFSDERIKKNIQDLDDGVMLNKLRLLKPKSYSYKDYIQNGSQPTYGFIAQEYKEVMGAYSCNIVSKHLPDYMDYVSHEIIETTEEYDEYITQKLNDDEKTVILTLKDTYDISVNDNIKVIQLDDSYQTLGTSLIDVREKHGNKITIDMELKPNMKHLFLYGKLCNDVHTIKKDLMFPVLVGSVQQNDRRIKALEDKQSNNLVIENQNDLVAIMEQQSKLINQMKEQMKVLQQRINYLELNI